MRNPTFLHKLFASPLQGAGLPCVIAMLANMLFSPMLWAQSQQLSSDELQRVDQLADRVNAGAAATCLDPAIILNFYDKGWQLLWDIESKQFGVPGKKMTSDERTPFDTARHKVESALAEAATIAPCIFRSK
jgi:hypothetical protein